MGAYLDDVAAQVRGARGEALAGCRMGEVTVTGTAGGPTGTGNGDGDRRGRTDGGTLKRAIRDCLSRREEKKRLFWSYLRCMAITRLY